MIINAVLEIVLTVLGGLISVIPEIKIGPEVSEPLSSVWEIFGFIDTFVDINVVIICVGLSLLIDNFGLLVKLFNFIWSKIPFVS